MAPRCGWIALTIVSLAFPGAAQDAGLVIRSTTNLVQVRLVAEDSKGKPVTDLRQSDFEILDNRKPQPIVLFTAEGAGPAASSDSASQSDALTDSPGGYGLLVLDFLNTLLPYRVKAKDYALHLLKTYQPRQKVALYILGHKPYLALDFTSDMTELAKVVEEVDIEFGVLQEAPSPRRGPGETVESQIFDWQNRVRKTVDAFGEISTMLARVPGRKSLVWVTEGFPMTLDGSVIQGAKPNELPLSKDIDLALARFNRADVAVYGVDVKGLSATPGWAGTLEEFALRTGATAFSGRNDVDEGIRLAFEDMRQSYTLGFHVPEGAAPGWHEIKVRVKRPGLTLRYRESYDWAGVGTIK